jgi:hypothetical protein
MTTNESTLSSNPTLESVKSQFAQWRATRVKGNRIPNSLWDAAKGLIRSYNYKQIAFELKINPNRLRKKIRDLSHQEDSLPTSSHFVKVSLPSSSSPSQEAPSLEQKIFYPHIHTGSLELTRVDGTILKASGLDNKALLSLIQGFLKQ